MIQGNHFKEIISIYKPMNQIREETYKSQKNQKELKNLSEKFEAIFVNMLLKEMRKSVAKSGFLDGGVIEEIFSDMLYHEYSEMIAKQTNLGISEKIFELYKTNLKNE